MKRPISIVRDSTLGVAAFLLGLALSLAAVARATVPCDPVETLWVGLTSHELDGVEVVEPPAHPLTMLSSFSRHEYEGSIYAIQVDDTQSDGLRYLVVTQVTP